MNRRHQNKMWDVVEEHAWTVGDQVVRAVCIGVYSAMGLLGDVPISWRKVTRTCSNA